MVANSQPWRSDTPAVAVEQRHGWLVPPAWEFVSEVWEFERKPVLETVYEHESEVDLLDGESPILKE